MVVMISEGTPKCLSDLVLITAEEVGPWHSVQLMDEETDSAVLGGQGRIWPRAWGLSQSPHYLCSRDS